jgi:HAD superfamily phosphatase
MNTNSPSAIVVFDIDGVIRDVSGSYRRALADTVENFTGNAYRPTPIDIDALKSEGLWNNDWEASQELIYRYFESQGTPRLNLDLDYKTIIAFFQSRYRGSNQENWNGYICTEPLLLEKSYLEQLTEAGIVWGFFSGATRASATYVLEKRLDIKPDVLIAMEDAPGKPDPTGLLRSVRQLQEGINTIMPVIYVGDTVADMFTVKKAAIDETSRSWIGVGVLPPHVQQTQEVCKAYESTLYKAGAEVVLTNVQQLTPRKIQELIVKEV